MKLTTTIYLFFSLFASAQTDQNFVDSLKFVSDVPYICRSQNLQQIRESPVPVMGCGDILFWRFVQQKQKIIPQLIEKLTDTTMTDMYVPYVGGQYTVADIALAIIEEIVDSIPTFKLLKIDPKKFDSPSYAFWTTIRADRLKFQMAMKKWYQENQRNLIWVSSEKTLTGDSPLKHPNGGHFELRK